MADIHTFILQSGSPEIALCAKWRLDALSDVLGTSLTEEIKRLEAFVADPTQQAAIMASCEGVQVGTCLLAEKELEPCHPVSPWLAGLYVVPEFRRLGVGATLIRAVEDEARSRGHAQVYLYADDAIAYYEKLGWRVVEQTLWHDLPMALMARALARDQVKWTPVNRPITRQQ